MTDTTCTAPLFPLPHGSILPGELLHIHIFEPRYRRMMEIVRDKECILAIASILPGYEAYVADDPPLSDVVGLGRVIKDRLNPDETSDIAIHGLARATIEEEIDNGEPFREAHLSLPPDPAEHPSESYRLTRDLFLGLSKRVRNRRFHCDITNAVPLGKLVDRIAGSLELPPDQRAFFMQSIDLEERIGLLLETLRKRQHRARFIDIIPSLTHFSLSMDAVGATKRGRS